MMIEIPYINPHKGQGHDCPYLLVGCMDFRFHNYLERSLDLVLGTEDCVFDYRGVVGGSKAFIEPDEREQAFESISLAIDKHNIGKLVLADHIDCGGYGGSAKFNDERAEEEFHKNQLKQARDLIKKKFPGLKITLLYQDWHSIKTVE